MLYGRCELRRGSKAIGNVVRYGSHWRFCVPEICLDTNKILSFEVLCIKYFNVFSNHEVEGLYVYWNSSRRLGMNSVRNFHNAALISTLLYTKLLFFTEKQQFYLDNVAEIRFEMSLIYSLKCFSSSKVLFYYYFIYY